MTSTIINLSGSGSHQKSDGGVALQPSANPGSGLVNFKKEIEADSDSFCT